ncbi:Scr1 family TA system antitoxin-like transcriptional regulator [Nocardia farcinica]|uniref:Scr1 family TA system antitoxin-like transcriptional regulator n=1 Tax=Nocardia farcinica TaxID=37329 RepID=UPI00245734E2|nr:Scr1 family TA system antitoxin-like transcriptional regulator [Nocardia farcinica]
MSNWPEPGRLRDVESADVYKCGRLAGTLRRDGDDVVFTYLEEYRADPETPPIAFTLPKHSEPVRTTGGSVPPFFAGLLPEGARLVAITALTRTSEDDHLSLLLAVGADTVGDVQVLPTGLSLTEPPVVYVESFAGSMHLETPRSVRAYREAFRRIQRVALDRSESKRLLRRVAKEYGP